MDGVAKKLENLVYRLQILKHRIALLRCKPNRILEEIYKKPPDPDPAASTVLTNAVVNDALHEREESLATMPREWLELQFTKQISTSPCTQGVCLFVPWRPTRTKVSFQVLLSSPRIRENSRQYKLKASKMSEGKELAESSKCGEKAVLVVNMTGARETLRPRFLGVGLILSVLLVNSRQLMDHMKRVWKIRGELEASPIECETGRKFILEFNEEGDRRHAILSGSWQYKGDAFLVEGLATGNDGIVGGRSADEEKGTVQDSEQVLAAAKSIEDTSNVNKKKTWKRKERVDLNEQSNSNSLVPPPGYGTVRAYEEIQDEDMAFEPAAKRSTFQATCLDKSFELIRFFLGKELPNEVDGSMLWAVWSASGNRKVLFQVEGPEIHWLLKGASYRPERTFMESTLNFECSKEVSLDLCR
ncbi:unnamed protein product [Miscanthus lutarioriparius]|uniref:DUF4283 domain-containing protein n=1 Tax=Miscanthus lutarioriparius TaxID=422564 RepID=A0A811S1C1_9POAL|nr:unnamed protein product [Miscanthus lutarioriparius]